MIKARVEMPRSAEMAGKRECEFPTIPRVGEVIKDVSNRYYVISAVVYQPFERETFPQLVIHVREGYGTSPEAVISGREKHGADERGV